LITFIFIRLNAFARAGSIARSEKRMHVYTQENGRMSRWFMPFYPLAG
jgi:hypothetical protein